MDRVSDFAEEGKEAETRVLGPGSWSMRCQAELSCGRVAVGRYVHGSWVVVVVLVVGCCCWWWSRVPWWTVENRADPGFSLAAHRQNGKLTHYLNSLTHRHSGTPPSPVILPPPVVW